MGILAITTVLTGSLIFFLLSLTMRIVLRNEGHRYTDQIMQAAALIPVIYGVFVLLIGLAPLH